MSKTVLDSRRFSCSGRKRFRKYHFPAFFIFFFIFPAYHDGCGPHWRLRSYSSQASEGLQDDWTAYDKRTEKKEERKKTRTTKRYTKHFKNADENRRKLRARKSTEKSKENRGWRYVDAVSVSLAVSVDYPAEVLREGSSSASS
ncbi:uncharacterized protein [Montipora capricornis]|uniref:uncharacterized protein isoform X3 n=1 Tax=Montipora capricornis TaxID=246305 RepID=UPI0035F20DB4